jgi:hypothetical protein
VLALLDGLEEQRSLSLMEKNFRKQLRAHLLNLLESKQVYWKRRSTIRWVKFGDENTKLFHSIATHKFRRNYITSLQSSDGTLVTDHEHKAAMLWTSFKDRLGQIEVGEMFFDLASLIHPIHLSDLDQPLEIDFLIKELPMDKAHGPDGFNGLFIKKFWPIIRDDFLALIREFYSGQANLRCLNSSFITLVPKNQSPASVNDYRLISLLGGPIKILNKLLANRVQKVITQLVHVNQYGFIKQKAIQHFLGWAFQYLHLCHSSKKEIVILKLNFEKAFDNVENQVILNMLQRKGFSSKWVGWIGSILSSGTSQVLLNGVPGKIIHCKRGVRQGDPLSPLFFVLVADLLQSLVNEAFQRNFITPPLSSSYG